MSAMSTESRQGRGETWSQTRTGCDATFYSGDPADERAAFVVAATLAATVREAMPEALVSVGFYDAEHGDRGQTPVTGWTVHATVSADDVAVIAFGPTHRSAIVRLRGIVSQAMAARWVR